jgi:drug/metabolite transporter (DMT)-like permease
MLIGFVILALFALIFENFSDVKLDIRGVGSVFYLGILGSVVTFSVYFWMLKKVEAVYLSLLAFVTPILAVILGSIILNEKLGFHVAYGGGIVLTGILLANGKELFKRISRSRQRI